VSVVHAVADVCEPVEAFIQKWCGPCRDGGGPSTRPGPPPQRGLDETAKVGRERNPDNGMRGDCCVYTSSRSASGSSSRAIDGSVGTSPCRSPYMPEMLNVTDSICLVRLAHCRSAARRS
jgi:hypothetical protein